MQSVPDVATCTTTCALLAGGRPIPIPAVRSVAVVPGSRATNLMLGYALAYCTIRIFAAALEEEYSGARRPYSGRSGFVTVKYEPALMAMVSAVGFILMNDGWNPA